MHTKYFVLFEVLVLLVVIFPIQGSQVPIALNPSAD